MASIGSRFNALLLNASEPFEMSEKKVKKPRKVTKPSQKPPQVKQVVEPESPPKPVEVPVKVYTKSAKVVVRDVVIPKENLNAATNGGPVIKVIEIPVTTARTVPQEGEEVSKDDRATKTKSAYRKVMVSSQGKMYDRHGGPKSRVRTTEKRHGHGAYNWGDVTESEILTNADETVVGDASKAATEEKLQPDVEQYTLEQYKEMLREKKVDPLSWDETPKKTENVSLPPYEDVRQYEYHREEEASRGRYTRGGRYRRGDSSRHAGASGEPDQQQEAGSRGRFRRGFGAPRAGHFTTTSRQSQKTATSTALPKVIKVDSINEFPSL